MPVRLTSLATAAVGLALLVGSSASAYNLARLKDRDANTDLVGSEWHGQDGSLGIITIRLQPRGLLVYTYRDGSQLKGLWRLQNDRLYFSVNNSYRETEGPILGRSFQGHSWNRVGSRWVTLLQRQK